MDNAATIKNAASEGTSASHCSVLWVGKLHHARRLGDDWGCIRDEDGELIIRINLPTHAEDVLNVHRRNHTDPTQARVDAILAALNKPNNMLTVSGGREKTNGQ